MSISTRCGGGSARRGAPKATRRTRSGSIDEVSLRRIDARRGFETLSAHYVTQQFTPHAHDEYVIGIIEAGVHSVWCRGCQRYAQGGTVVTMNPGDSHHGGAGDVDGWVQRMMYIDEDTMASWAEQCADRPVDPPRFREAFRIEERTARALLDTHLALHEEFALVGDVRLSDLFADLLGRFAERFAAHSADAGLGRLARARDFLHAHLSDDVSLSDVADVVGLRPRQVINLFNRHLGLPPHNYHLVLRVNAAKRLLRDGEPPAECAAAVGFYDQPHMTRHFRAMVGITPAAYAASV